VATKLWPRHLVKRAQHEAPALSRVCIGQSDVMPVSQRCKDGSVPEPGDHRPLCAITKAKQGDRDALWYLYCRYADSIYEYVASLSGDTHQAQRLTQSGFARLITEISAV
jgi:hypothetical protein